MNDDPTSALPQRSTWDAADTRGSSMLLASSCAGRSGSGQAMGLTPTQEAALWGLVRWPFISPQDLCLGLDGAGTSTVYHALSHLHAHHLIEAVPYVSSRVQHERLWYLAERGVRLAARLAGADPATFAHTWGLGEAALLRRLGRLEHLTLCRGFLLDLQAAVRDAHRAGLAGPLMAAWRPWPVALADSHRHRHAECILDGAGTLVWASAGAPPCAAEFVLVWDDGSGLALEVLRPRLLALLRARAERDQAIIRARAADRASTPAGFPTVLVVAARPERARGALALAADIARRERVSPLALLLTSAPLLRARGPAHAPWRDPAGTEGPLAAMLAPHAVPSGDPRPCSVRDAAADMSRYSRSATVAGRGSVLVRGLFAQRSRARLAALADHAGKHRPLSAGEAAQPMDSSGRGAHGSQPEERRCLTHSERALLVPALGPADLRFLRSLGLLPLATYETLASLTGDQWLPSGAPARRRDTPRPLARLLRWGLADYDVPTRAGAHAQRRYFLTSSGLAVLATTAGLTPASYSRLGGAVAGTRRSSDLPTRRQRDRPHRSAARSTAGRSARWPAGRTPRQRVHLPRRGPRGGGYQLAYCRRYAEHTESVQAVFVGFVRAARAAVDAGRDHALEAWQFEWAAVRRFPLGGTWQTLRPDAYGRYRVGRQVLAFFLEIDRGTSGLRALETKLAGYAAYRDSGLYTRDPAHGALAFPVILVVTTGEERLRHILEAARAVAVEHLTRPLVVWVATAADQAAQGPLGRIWRNAARHPARALWREADAGVGGAQPRGQVTQPEPVPDGGQLGAARRAGEHTSLHVRGREPPSVQRSQE